MLKSDFLKHRVFAIKDIYLGKTMKNILDPYGFGNLKICREGADYNEHISFKSISHPESNISQKYTCKFFNPHTIFDYSNIYIHIASFGASDKLKKDSVGILIFIARNQRRKYEYTVRNSHC